MGSHTVSTQKDNTYFFLYTMVKLCLRAEHLPNKEIFGLSDPYFCVGQNGQALYKSEMIQDQVEFCEWQPAEFQLLDPNSPIDIKILDQDDFTEDALLVEFTLSYPFRRAVLEIPDLPTVISVLNNDPESSTQINQTDQSAGNNFMKSMNKEMVFKVVKVGKKMYEAHSKGQLNTTKMMEIGKDLMDLKNEFGGKSAKPEQKKDGFDVMQMASMGASLLGKKDGDKKGGLGGMLGSFF